MDSNSQSTDDGGEFGTPTKDSQESKQTTNTTPAKRKLQFDFWTTEKKSKLEKSVKVNIEAVKEGKDLANIIQFRVSYKSLKIVSKKGIPMFKFTALDHTGEISIVAYGSATDKWFDMIMLNRTFQLTNFDAKEENPKFRSPNNHGYEIILNEQSVVTEIDGNLPDIQFDFQTIKEILQKETSTNVDMLGVMVKIWELEKVGNDKIKRDIVLTDQTKQLITATLWGKQAEEFDEKLFTVIAIRNASMASYMGSRNLNIYSGSLFWANPTLDQAMEIKKWFEENKPKE